MCETLGNAQLVLNILTKRSVSIFGIVARVNELSPKLGDGVDR